MTEANTALEDLEIKVVDLDMKVTETESAVNGKLEEEEGRITENMSTKVRAMVIGQLKEAGFDPDMTAADLSTRMSARPGYVNSYASAAAAPGLTDQTITGTSKQNRQEEKYNEARRALRLWSVAGGDWEGLGSYLRGKLCLTRDSWTV